MKKITPLIMTAVTAVLFAACGAPAENKPANTANSNVAKAPAPPTKDALLAIEKGAFEAWKNKDGKYFEANLDDKFMMPTGPGKTSAKADAVKMIAENKCSVASYTMSDEKMTPAGADAAVLTTTVTQDVTCEGKKEPSQIVTASVFVRRGDAWKIAFHNEVPVKAVDKAAATAKSADVPADKKEPAPAADKKADAPVPIKKADTAPSDQLTTAEDKKPVSADAKKAETDGKEAAPKSGDAATDALMAMETEGWEAWKARDAKRLSDWTTSDVGFVDSSGQVFATKDATIKSWTGSNCDIKSVTVSDGTSVAVTSDASILISKGTATGTCEGQKVPPLWGMSVYVKQDGNWRLAYLMEWEG